MTLLICLFLHIIYFIDNVYLVDIVESVVLLTLIICQYLLLCLVSWIGWLLAFLGFFYTPDFSNFVELKF